MASLLGHEVRMIKLPVKLAGDRGTLILTVQNIVVPIG